MPPKAQSKNQPKIVYPSGVKEVTDDLGTDELVRRLKQCAQSFQSMGQDDENHHYIPLAMHLSQDYFLEHSSKDVRLLVACCIADVFRVYAPEAPYKDPDHLKIIFLFLIKQLKGLADPKDPAFKRYFYLLENLAWVKSFNICIELEDNQEIFCQLFTLMFTIVNDDHSTKVKVFMLDMMSPLISEADSVSQELLDVILSNIIEPRKTQNKNAYNLAKELLKRTASTIEPYIQTFFNNALILGKTSESDVASHLYDLIYELNSISPSILLSVLPQLEFKLKSNDEKERLEVTRLLARMFSDKDSELAVQHKALWNCFLGRFNDISVQVRIRCVQYSMHFLLNQPELRADITEQLKLRQHDPEETVRYEVVMAIISAAKRDFKSICDDALDFVKERTLDKKFKIRREALLGLSVIYKKCMNNPDVAESTKECISWIKNKVLHVYYQTALEDRLLVERILHTCLVPFQLPTKERMKKLYQLYSTVDEHAVKAFNELLKCQNIVRNHVRALLEHLSEDKTVEREQQMTQKSVVLSKSLPDPVKAQEFLKKFVSVLENDVRLRNHMETVMNPNCTCKEAEESVKEVLKKLGNPVMTNVFYMTVKQMLERVAPVLVDKESVSELLDMVNDELKGISSIEDIGPVAGERGLKLLLTLSQVFPATFQHEDTYSQLIQFLSYNDEVAAEITLQILTFIGTNLEENYPNVAIILVPQLQTFAQSGTVKQAKHAVKCMVTICQARKMVFDHTLQELKKNLTLESDNFRTALVSIGHIAFHCPDLFQADLKNIVSKKVVKELLMQSKERRKDNTEDWCNEDMLSEETKAKIEGMKLMVRWLMGLKIAVASGVSTLRLLTTVIMHDGDLMEKGEVSCPERSWLRLAAGCCILKLCQEPTYAEALTPDQFVHLALLVNDSCDQVRERFSQKLHKGLISLKLPLEFMAAFCLVAYERNRELKVQGKQFLLANINKRREYLKQHTLSNEKILLYLPDYVLPYSVHLLSHYPEYKLYDNKKSLIEIKDCLWFLLEPLVNKNENYSFSFFKKMIENIKNAKDILCPEDEAQNRKLYAVADLAFDLVYTKSTNFILLEFPIEPKLPHKLYTEIDKNYSNTKLYIPTDMVSSPPKKSGIELGVYGVKPHIPKEPTVPSRGRGRPRMHPKVEIDTSRLKRPATNGKTQVDDGSKLAVAESKRSRNENSPNDNGDEETVHKVGLAENKDEDKICEEEETQTGIVEEASDTKDSSRSSDHDDKESTEEKEKENTSQNNQRTKRFNRDFNNRKDDDSQDHGGGRGGTSSRESSSREEPQGTKSTDSKDNGKSKDDGGKDSSGNQAKDKDSSGQKNTKQTGVRRATRSSNLQEAIDSRIITRRTSSMLDSPQNKRQAAFVKLEKERSPKRIRSDGTTSPKSSTAKSTRSDDKCSEVRNNFAASSLSSSQKHHLPLPQRNPLTRNTQTSNSPRRTIMAESTKHPSMQKLESSPVQEARKTASRGPILGCSLDHKLHSKVEGNENSSPRKSSRIQAKDGAADVLGKLNIKRPATRGGRR